MKLIVLNKIVRSGFDRKLDNSIIKFCNRKLEVDVDIFLPLCLLVLQIMLLSTDWSIELTRINILIHHNTML